MKVTVKVKTNLRVKQVQAEISESISGSLRDTVADIAKDAIKLSPVLTGNNRRSIKFEVGPDKEVAKRKGEAAVYSTSGYGGYIETGTVNKAAQPYMKPALDMNIHKLPKGIKARLK